MLGLSALAWRLHWELGPGFAPVTGAEFMTVKQSPRRSSIKRGVSLFGLGASLLIGTAAIAGSVSLIYSDLQMPDTLVAKWLVRPLAAVGLVGLNGTGTVPLTLDPATGTVNSTTQTVTSTPTPTPAILPAKFGINISPSQYSSGNRAFMNLLASDHWRLHLADKTIADPTPADQLDNDANIIRLDTNQFASRKIIRPTATLLGRATDVICRWQGTGTFMLAPRNASTNVSYGNHSLRFTYLPGYYPDAAQLYITSVDPNDPAHDVDCRETDADPNMEFDPTFLANVKKYNTIRFMDWEQTNDNAPVTWATRTRPGLSYYIGDDGYAIEYMIDLCNQAHANMWITVPWNGDDDYVRRFAQLVRDRLDPSLKVYVEVSNEVWNWNFKVATQAYNEGLAENIFPDNPDNKNKVRFFRQAEKIGQVMDIWTDVFSGQMGRLVRVAAAQNWDYVADLIMGFRDTATKVDAVASAPYFNLNLDKYPIDPNDLQGTAFTPLSAKIDKVFADAMKVKGIADRYGKRYITYEAGQSVLGGTVDQIALLNRDPRMGLLYTEYMTKWQQQFGDLMMLFNDISPISKFGAWGLQEYQNAPLSQSPKALAVNRFLASIDNSPD